MKLTDFYCIHGVSEESENSHHHLVKKELRVVEPSDFGHARLIEFTFAVLDLETRRHLFE